jgi:hypothetical protein
MQVFKTKWFTRFARQEEISDKALHEAIERAERGLIDADLGGGRIKQRVARRSAGRSGGYRTIIAYCAGSKAFFLLGFAKSDQDNVDDEELINLRTFGKRLLVASTRTICGMLDDSSLLEVRNDKEE